MGEGGFIKQLTGFNSKPQPQQQPQQQQQLKVSYHMSTRNKSFLEMHYFLRAKGIVNNAFMLSLIDTDLAGVDPFDPNLSLLMKQKIHNECRRNFWYYVRECVRVVQTGSPQGVPFILNRGNMAFFFTILQNINVWFELPRQQGKTLSAEVFYSWLYNYGTANTEIWFSHTKQAFAVDNLDAVKNIISMLPSYLQMRQEYSLIGDKKKKAKDNATSLENAITNNKINITSSARSKTAAGTLLRGKTIGHWWNDEFAFQPYNDVVYSSTAPALRTAFDNARYFGKPYGVIITTTPGVLTSEEGQYANEFRLECTPFNERMYDKTPEQMQAIVNSNIKSSFVYVSFTWQQLGKDSNWLFNQCREIGWHKIQDIRREIFLEWSLMSENCPFSTEDLEEIEKYVNHKPINEIEFMGQYIVKIYKLIALDSNMVPRHPPIIGVDVGGGYRRDYSAFTIIDSQTTDVIATFKSNIISVRDFTRLLLEVVTYFYPNAILCIERNGGYGASVIAYLKESKIKKNLYYEIKDKIIEEQTDGIRIKRKSVLTKVFGVDSTHENRDLVIETLRERVMYHKNKFSCPDILAEMKCMEVKKNGRIEHSNTSHDDLVFSYLWALYVWYYGKDLKANYNIDKREIKTDAGIDDVVTSLDQKYTSVIEEVIPPESEEAMELDDQINGQLGAMKKAQGTLIQDFFEKRKQKEDQMFRDSLQFDKRFRNAIKQEYNLTDDQINERYLGSETGIPDSIFANFNEDLEEQEEKRFRKEFNLINFDPGR